MGERKQNGEWIDADEWAIRENLLDGIDWPRGVPLDYANAAALADDHGLAYEHHSDGTTLIRVGKARAGRLLDGIEHNGMPSNAS